MTNPIRTGVLNLDKPPGITSHDLVDLARKAFRQKRIGHGGILDPFAGGVLLVGIGTSTRLLPFLTDLPKEYVATLRLGEETSTLDTEAPVTRRLPVPELDPERLREVLAGFLGAQEQVPPAFSAVRIDGVRAYERARRGETVVLPARRIVVDEIELVDLSLPHITFRARVSKGTYLRRLAADLAGRLGTCGHLTALSRTVIGNHRLADSLTVDVLARAADGGELDRLVIPPSRAMSHMTSINVDGRGAEMIRYGLFPADHWRGVPPAPGEMAIAVGPEDDLAAIVTGTGDPVAPFVLRRVFPPA
jgi:tRNA pseudouridine55 synthase